MNGWIKLHRDILRHPIWLRSRPEWRSVLIEILCQARYIPTKELFNGKEITLQPGQLIISLRQLARDSRASLMNVRSAINLFTTLNFLTQQPTHRGILITIVNWAIYQCATQEDNTATNTEVTHIQHSSNTPNHSDISYTPSYEECKNVRSKETTTSVADAPPLKEQPAIKSKPFADRVVDAYSRILPELPKVRKLTSSLSKAIMARKKDIGDIEDFEKYFNDIREMPFLMGEVEPSKEGQSIFKADLFFLMGPNNYGKIMASKYERKAKKETEELNEWGETYEESFARVKAMTHDFFAAETPEARKKRLDRIKEAQELDARGEL